MIAVIPMFNEGATIKETLQSLLDSDYPHGKLKVDLRRRLLDRRQLEQAREIARAVERPAARSSATAKNVGKRCSIIRAVREADEPRSSCRSTPTSWSTTRRRFASSSAGSPADRIAAVGGWVDVRNKQDNWLTRMQVVRYWYAYHFMKNLEWGIRRVLCLSGCLTAYRRGVLVELEPVLEHRAICGVPIKYGEDRFLTRQIVKAGYLTTMTLNARCCTTVPTTLSGYFSQQLRWRRSNTIDYAGGVHATSGGSTRSSRSTYFSLFALQYRVSARGRPRARLAPLLRRPWRST